MQNTQREQLVQALRSAVAELFSLAPEALAELAVDITMPTEKSKADFVSNIAFPLAKKVGKAPLVIAETIAAHLTTRADITTHTTVTACAPGFLNFTLNDASLAQAVAGALKAGASYGASKRLAGQVWEIDHTSPNPNKPMHIGHLRNNVLSMALVHLFEFAGARVIAEAVDNNRGIAIARAMWGFLISKRRASTGSASMVGAAANPPALLAEWIAHPDQWLTPADEHTKPDFFVGQCYLAGVDAAKKDPASDAAIRDLALKWEQDNADVWALWKLMVDYAHEGIAVTLERLGNRWDHVWHEHEHYKMGKRIVEEGLAKGIFVRGDEGAIITNLAEFKTPDTVLLKSDGTALYITQDLALTQLKKEKHHANKYLWVIGPEQGLAMKQMFLAATQLGIGTLDDFVHIAYGLVNMVDAQGNVRKMSSRGGETILADELLDETKASLLAAGRDYTPDMAESLAVSAVKYSLLRAARNSNIIFSTEKALSMEGDSGVYVLYTYARMKSVIAKANTAGISAPTELPAGATFTALERALAVEILHFPLLVEKALDEMSPHVLVEFITHISQRFNALYAQEQFVTAEDSANTAKKVFLTSALAGVSETIFALLGMKPLERV